MTYLEFSQNQPALYGYVNFVNGGQKIGAYILEQSPYSGVYVYRHHVICSKNGKEYLRRGNYAVSKKRAFELLLDRQLSLNPENGKKENYL